MSVDWLRAYVCIVDQASIASVSAPTIDKSHENTSSSRTTEQMVSGLSRPVVPFQPRQPLPPQQQEYQKPQKGNVRPTGPVRGKGKTYTLTVDQANASGEVVTCIILVHSTPAHVLFDSGDTHCFISSHFISKQNISCDTVYWG